jgi:hypothetical protein
VLCPDHEQINHCDSKTILLASVAHENKRHIILKYVQYSDFEVNLADVYRILTAIQYIYIYTCNDTSSALIVKGEQYK